MASSELVGKEIASRTEYRASAVERAIREAQRAELAEVGPRGRGKAVVQWGPEALLAVGCLLCLHDIGIPMTEAATTVAMFRDLPPYSAYTMDLESGLATPETSTAIGPSFGVTINRLIDICGSVQFSGLHEKLAEIEFHIEMGFDWSSWGRIQTSDLANKKASVTIYRPRDCVKPEYKSLVFTRSRSVTFPLGLLGVLGDLWADSQVRIAERSAALSENTAIPGGVLGREAEKVAEGIPAPSTTSSDQLDTREIQTRKRASRSLTSSETTRAEGVCATGLVEPGRRAAGHKSRTHDHEHQPRRRGKAA